MEILRFGNVIASAAVQVCYSNAFRALFDDVPSAHFYNQPIVELWFDNYKKWRNSSSVVPLAVKVTNSSKNIVYTLLAGIELQHFKCC